MPFWERDLLLDGLAVELELERGEGLRVFPRGERDPGSSSGRPMRRRGPGDIPMGGDLEHPSWGDLPKN
jgi:hypothetical protein